MLWLGWGEEWRGGPFGGGDAGFSYPTDICRPLCHKARKISLLGANNPKWKPGALENLRLTRFTCSVLMAGERSQKPPRHAQRALKWRKAHEDLKTNTPRSQLAKEEWVKEPCVRTLLWSHNLSSRNNTNPGQRKAIPLPRVVPDFLLEFTHTMAALSGRGPWRIPSWKDFFFPF